MNNGTCILAGWGIPHACAAALALRRYPEATVRSASQRYLARALENLLSEGGAQRLVIAGVPFGPDADSVGSTLADLHTNGCQAVWFAYGPHKAPAALEGLVAVHLSRTPEEMCGDLVEVLGLRTDARAREILRTAQAAENHASEAVRTTRELLLASMSAYVRFRDAEPFPAAIRTVALGLSPSEAQEEMIKEFRLHGERQLIGRSAPMEDLRRKITVLAREGKCRVLITGETGVGKETVAYLIHAGSARREAVFFEFNCADLNPHLLESRLFGYEKGAFTGATQMREGAFKEANGGTLFLDEVGELPLPAQAGLLRVLQEGRFCRMGGHELVTVDVRVIAATNRDIEAMVRDGTFRADLYYRLNAIRLDVPPLRERREDIGTIADGIWRCLGLGPLTPQQTAVLERYDWPGNVRELQNVLERARVFGERDFRKLLTSPVQAAQPTTDDLGSAIRAHVQKVYNRHGGHKTNTARALGISLNTMKRHLEPPARPEAAPP